MGSHDLDKPVAESVPNGQAIRPQRGSSEAKAGQFLRSKRSPKCASSARRIRVLSIHESLRAARTVLLSVVCAERAPDSSTFSGVKRTLHATTSAAQRIPTSVSGGTMPDPVVTRWAHEQARTPSDQTEDSPLLPEHMCSNEEDRHRWRTDVLSFIREHIEIGETYRLSQADLEFGDLLPSAPECLAQEDFED